MRDPFIPDDDLRVTVWTSRLPGGQHVGVPRAGVQVEHLPTGIRVSVETDRSQHRNRAIAIDAILGALTGGNYR